MTEADDETLKAEIDEIMHTVDAIMDKVARVVPDDDSDSKGNR